MKDKLNSNLISEDELEAVNGGKNLSDCQKMRVARCPHLYLSMRQDPAYNSVEISRLLQGYIVLSDGRKKQGLNREGETCYYTHVWYQEKWGYAESDYLKEI